MDVNQSLPSSKSPTTINGNLKHMLDNFRPQFPKFKHEKHGQVINVNEAADEQLTLGQKIADAVASTVGSWRFIIIQSIILIAWIIINTVMSKPFDVFPFVLLNLVLSFQAAYSAPFVMMSQNRQADKDRLTAQNDYVTDCKGEEEVRHMMDHLDHQDDLTLQVVQRLEAQNQRIENQDKLIIQLMQKMDAQHQALEAQRVQLLQWLSAGYPEIAKKIDAEAGTGEQPAQE